MADDISRTTADVIEHNPQWWALTRGRKAFKDGKSKPQDIWTDEQWSDRLNEGQCELLGWMLERGVMLMQQYKVRAYIEEGDDL